jgi:hypothetical protein
MTDGRSVLTSSFFACYLYSYTNPATHLYVYLMLPPLQLAYRMLSLSIPESNAIICNEPGKRHDRCHHHDYQPRIMQNYMPSSA